MASCDDLAVGPAEGSEAVPGRDASPGAGGLVSRPGLFGQLGASARVTVVSAPPGSGKTVLLRSWIGEAGLGQSAAWDRLDVARARLAGPRYVGFVTIRSGGSSPA